MDVSANTHTRSSVPKELVCKDSHHWDYGRTVGPEESEQISHFIPEVAYHSWLRAQLVALKESARRSLRKDCLSFALEQFLSWGSHLWSHVTQWKGRVIVVLDMGQ